MKEKLKELEKDSLLIIKSSGYLGPAPGSNEAIITKDGMIYYYSHYLFNNDFLKENNIPQESLSNGKELEKEKFNKLIKFIEENVVGKTFEERHMMDATFSIRVNYNNETYVIVNYPELNHELNEIIRGGDKNDQENGHRISTR